MLQTVYEIEMSRTNVTPAQFMYEVRRRLIKEGLGLAASDMTVDYLRHEDLTFPLHYNEEAHCWEQSTGRPYQQQTYTRNDSGEVYNEILEFTFDDEKKGHGYFYTVNVLDDSRDNAPEAAQKAQEAAQNEEAQEDTIEAAQKAQKAQEGREKDMTQKEAQEAKKAQKKAAQEAQKKETYSEFGIEYCDGKIKAPVFGWISPLLVNGNKKLGRGVWTWSTLPTNKLYQIQFREDGPHIDSVEAGAGDVVVVPGTCPCHCPGCYATRGCYNFPGVKLSLAIKTYLLRLFPVFVKNAIFAQIEADHIEAIRVHAAGDFANSDEIQIFRSVSLAFPEVISWTYTKVKEAETAFDDVDNFNVVRSILPFGGLNYGHCDYILDAYRRLLAAGEDVYICRCGIDDAQHCNTCAGCRKHKYVLFIEHSTGYKPQEDPAFEELKAVIEAQAAQ